MSESKQDRYEEKVRRSEANRLNDPAWANVPQDIALQFATNAPAGFGAESYGFVPGQVVPTETVLTALQRLNEPGHYEGITGGITLDQYIADPRSVVKFENGQFIYRPELSKGDFISTDRESFLESLGGIPLLASFLAGPFAQVAGWIGPAAGGSLGGASVGAEEFFTGMNSLVPGGSGVAEAIAASGTLTAPAGAGELLNTLKPIGTIASTVGAVAGAVGSVASTANVLNAQNPINSLLPANSGTQNPFVINLPGAADMATPKTASTATTPIASSMNMQTLLTLAVVAVIAFAVMGELKE